jgi:primosomal protein N''
MIRDKNKKKELPSRFSKKTKQLPQGEKPSENVDPRAMRRAARFFSENEQAIRDYAQKAGLTFETRGSLVH